MAACKGLRQIFVDKPIPDNPTLIESLSPWSQIKSPLHNPPIDPSSSSSSSYTEIFGELHFKENPQEPEPKPLPSPSRSPSPSSIGRIPESSFGNLTSSTGDGVGCSDSGGDEKKRRPSSSADSAFFSSFRVHSPMNSESLQLCTEGLGFESSDDVEDDGVIGCSRNSAEVENDDDRNPNRIPKSKQLEIESNRKQRQREFRRSKSYGGAFPPPISSIGKTGKPCVSFRSFRKDGRFVLKEIRVPRREFLQASRENGRLKLQLVQPEEQIREEEEEGEEDEDEDENEEEENASDAKGGRQDLEVSASGVD